MVKIPYATTSDGTLYTAQTYVKEKERKEGLVCFGCKANVYYVEGFNKRNKFGELHKVSSHFKHTIKTGCPGGGESVEHRIAKNLASSVPFTFSYACRRCKQLVPSEKLAIDYRGMESREEYHWRDRNNTLFVPDIAFLMENEIHTAIEIFHTSPMSEEKIAVYNEAGINWIEVRASSVIEAYNEGKPCVMIEKSSYVKEHCVRCANALRFIEGEKRRKQSEEETRRKRMEAIDTERQTRQLIIIEDDDESMPQLSQRTQFSRKQVDAYEKEKLYNG